MIPASSKYPVAPAMIHPTRSPTTTAVDFMIGDPKRSQMMIVTKTLKPNPMNCADPQGRACGALVVGHNLKIPVVGRVLQVPELPAQFWNPDLMRFVPMSRTVGPVTSGGKIFFKYLGLVKDIPISRRAHRAAVPRIAPD